MTEPPAGRLYRFVQFEYPWALGPQDGRYVMRDHAGEDPHHVLIVSTHPAARRARRSRWGRDAVTSPEPSETALCRATIVDADAVEESAAKAWLEEAAGAGGRATLEEAAALLNSALRAHRAAAADPYARDVLPTQALVARAGYGAGFEVADGQWTAARELETADRTEGSRRERRTAALRPQERLAALLSGRDAVLACEEMVLRARLDLDAGRAREAALQAHLAVEAAVAELQAFSGRRNMAERLVELEGLRGPLSAAANEALQGGPSEPTVEQVRAGVERIEAALRSRSAAADY